MRKYLGKFWNVVLPIGLMLVMFSGLALIVCTNKMPDLRWVNVIGYVMTFTSMIAFSGIRNMIDKSDIKALEELEAKGFVNFYGGRKRKCTRR